MPKNVKLAFIGLDTSHAIEFTRLIQGDAPSRVSGLKVEACMRFPSPFQSEPKQNQRQKILEGWGVKVTRCFDEAVANADAILLEINDPAQHWSFFRQAAEMGKPIFIDKPLAGNPVDARKIVERAHERGIPVWESSSLRFSPDLAAAVNSVGSVELGNVYGALGKAAAGSSLVWYGCHTFQMLQEVMGMGARRVRAVEGNRGVVAIVEYEDGRRGVVECITNCWRYGGRVQNEARVEAFQSTGGGLYRVLLERIRRFVRTGKPQVALEASLEVQDIMDAAEKALKTGMRRNVRRGRS